MGTWLMHLKIINIHQQDFMRQESKTLIFLHILMIFKEVILIEEAVGGDANSSRDYTQFNLCQLHGNLADAR